MDLRLKRAYEPARATDGYRVLIDGLWPRGISRERAHLDEWARELAPSARTSGAGSDTIPARFAQFRRRYAKELAAQETKLRELRRRAAKGR